MFSSIVLVNVTCAYMHAEKISLIDISSPKNN